MKSYADSRAFLEAKLGACMYHKLQALYYLQQSFETTEQATVNTYI